MQILDPVSQICLLKSYISTLEQENLAKNKQTQTLYLQLQSLSCDYKNLQIKLDNVKLQQVSRKKTRDNADQNIIINKLNQQIELLKSQQQHLFNQNIQILQNLEINQRRINDLQEENYNLRTQKQELQKFRLNLDKISQSLLFIQQEKQQLVQSNYQLLSQNQYLKSIIQQSQNQLKKQTLLAKSFQKIQQYDEQFEESQEESVQKVNSSKLLSKKKPNIQDYLMEELSRSYEMNQSLDKSKDQQIEENIQIEFDEEKDFKSTQNDKKVRIQDYLKQESCDVIQDMYEELSRDDCVVQNKQTNFLESTVKLDQLRKDKIDLEKKYEDLTFQKQKLQNKVREMIKIQAINTKQMQNKIQAVIENYEKIQKVVNQRERQIEEMYQIIQNLENSNQELSGKLYEKQNLIRQSIRANRKQGQNSILKNVTKQTLIKQNNLLIQMINSLQKQKNELYIELYHGKQNWSYGNNLINSQDPRIQETVAKIQKRTQNKVYPQKKKKSQLQKRIQSLKMQNQEMLQNLAIE